VREGSVPVIPNLLLGAVIAVFAGYFLTEAAALPPRARMFPQAVLWGMAAAGVLIMAQAVASRLRGNEPDGSGALASALVWQIAIPGGVLVGTYLLLTFVGFYLSVPVLLVALYLYHVSRAAPERLGPVTIAWSLGFAAIATLGMYVLFTLLLRLPAPSGALF
jgi:putative tricarboxylic transport membrane protein